MWMDVQAHQLLAVQTSTRPVSFILSHIFCFIHHNHFRLLRRWPNWLAEICCGEKFVKDACRLNACWFCRLILIYVFCLLIFHAVYLLFSAHAGKIYLAAEAAVYLTACVFFCLFVIHSQTTVWYLHARSWFTAVLAERNFIFVHFIFLGILFRDISSPGSFFRPPPDLYIWIYHPQTK